MPGKLICLDGFEGAGKTTRAEALQATLEAYHGRRCMQVREPGGDAFSEKIRDIMKFGDCEITALAEVFAFNAARANMLTLRVAPQLAEGVDVIADRTYISTLTYQGYGNGLEAGELEKLRRICLMAIEPAPPDLIVVLDVSFEASMMRIGNRGEQTDRFEGRSEEYLKKVLYGYLAEADIRGCPVVNANKTPWAVDAAILQQVLPILD